MRIAVCLSGQPRTAEFTVKSIQHYFSGDYETDYFCHAWDYDTRKMKKDSVYWSEEEPVNTDNLQIILNKYDPKLTLIESKKDCPSEGQWHSLFYSMMIANNLKKQYEIKNNFRYDFVVRARYDSIFDPESKFTIKQPNHPLDLYINHADRMKTEFNRINLSDVFFYGSSYCIDIVTDVYRHISSTTDDLSYLGPGALLHDYCTKYNIVYIKNGNAGEVVYRKECIPADPITKYRDICMNHVGYYQA